MRHAPPFAALLVALGLGGAAAAPPPEPAAPPQPAKYDVQVRYRIDAFGRYRIDQFNDMARALDKYGLARDEGPEDEAEDPANTRLTGTAPAAAARKLLAQRYVEALRLVPAGAKLPAAAERVRVQLELAAGPVTGPGRFAYDTAAVRKWEDEGGAVLNRQRLLANQARFVLYKLGFHEAIGYDDRAHTRLLGSVPAGRLEALLEDLRRQPAAWQLPAGPPIDSVVLAGLRRYRGGEDVLRSVLKDWEADPDGAKLLEKMTAAWAKKPVAVAYLKRLPGVVTESPATVKALLVNQMIVTPESADLLQGLLDDVLASSAGDRLMGRLLRRLPAHVIRDLPLLLRTDSPIRVTEVQTDLPMTKDRLDVPAIPKGQEKLTPELRALLGGDAATPQRLEVILWLTPRDNDSSWVRDLSGAAPEAVIEGRVGPLVSVLMPPSRAVAVAALPVVSTVRLPRSGEPRLTGAAGEKIETPEALKDSGLVRLHSLNHKGRGVRLAVIDGDFRGWEGQVGKKLPAGTRLIDLTAERNADLKPDPFPAGAGLGRGTHVAMVAALAAPEAEIVLLRVGPAAPYEILTLARCINGAPLRSLNLARRSAELEAGRSLLDIRQRELLKERAEALADVGDDPDAVKKRAEYKKHQAAFDADERDHRERSKRWLALEEDLRGLRTVRVVTSGLSWREGMPVDGGGALSRYFDEQPFKKALWFQAAGDTRGQAWAGPFRDRDADGVMEFLPPGAPLPPNRWAPTLAFLSWKPAAGATTADLPANARLRVSVQWREPHDPDLLRDGDDLYREPLALVGLVLLRQLDPAGAKQPADDFQMVAVTSGLPQRLDNAPNSAVYEQTLEFTVKEAGRYALRLEGLVPPSIRPPGAPTVPAAEKTWEMRPRLFVETLGGAGRAVLTDLATGEGTIGAPGDARQAITVGAADGAGKPAPSSAPGPAFNLELLPKPTVLAPAVGAGDGPAPDTSLAAAYAAGLAASALSAGAPPAKFLQEMRAPPGRVLRVPDDWPGRAGERPAN